MIKTFSNIIRFGRICSKKYDVVCILYLFLLTFEKTISTITSTIISTAIRVISRPPVEDGGIVVVADVMDGDVIGIVETICEGEVVDVVGVVNGVVEVGVVVVVDVVEGIIV